jgi:hypothetical protein
MLSKDREFILDHGIMTYSARLPHLWCIYGSNFPQGIIVFMKEGYQMKTIDSKRRNDKLI